MFFSLHNFSVSPKITSRIMKPNNMSETPCEPCTSFTFMSYAQQPEIINPPREQTSSGGDLKTRHSLGSKDREKVLKIM